jgi:hypothetical protein
MPTADRTSDKPIRCASCGDEFVFSSGEQELFRLRGITSEPQQCPACARGRKVVASGRSNRTAR